MDVIEAPRSLGTLELVGRAPELDLLAGFVDRSSAGGATLLLTGAAGVGKRVLLDAVCRMGASRPGGRLLRGRGVEFGAEVSFAGLHEVLLPLHDHLAALAEHQRQVLSMALGMEAGESGGRLAVSAAVRALLRHVGREGPVLVVVDDLQWLDRASAVSLFQSSGVRVSDGQAVLRGPVPAADRAAPDHAPPTPLRR